MAKEIKAIKCPQCGSTDKTEIKPDFYRCNSCQTEYFLDDDDVTINYNHNYSYNNDNKLNGNKAKRVSRILAAVFVLFFVLIMFFSFLRHSNPTVTPSNSFSQTVTPEKKKEFNFNVYDGHPMVQPGSLNPIVMAVEGRDYNDDADKSKDGYYLTFYDPLTKKLLSEQKIGKENTSASDIKIKVFSDGNTYLISENTLYVLDKNSWKFRETGKQFFNAKKELQVGVATLEFVYEYNGDGLILLTNDGKKLYYYPLVQKLYTETGYYKAQEGFNNLLPGAKEKVYHTFSGGSSDYPDENVQLLTIRYMDNGNGPKYIKYGPSWMKDYGRSGIIMDDDPYRKVLFNDYSKWSGRILSWKDLTPERLYFSPEVLFDNGPDLIIKFKANANPKSTYSIQQLNVKTGTVEWTSVLPNGDDLDEMVKYKTGFMAVTNNEGIILFDLKGNIIENYKID